MSRRLSLIRRARVRACSDGRHSSHQCRTESMSPSIPNAPPQEGCRRPNATLHWWQTKRLMPLPVWIVAIRDPAYAYMLRSGGDYRRRPRLLRRRGGGHGFTGYVPLGSVRAPKPTAEEIKYLQAQAATEHRRYMARFHDIETRHGELLRATAGALAAKGTSDPSHDRGGHSRADRPVPGGGRRP
jgi:hypothetical protein